MVIDIEVLSFDHVLVLNLSQRLGLYGKWFPLLATIGGVKFAPGDRCSILTVNDVCNALLDTEKFIFGSMAAFWLEHEDDQPTFNFEIIQMWGEPPTEYPRRKEYLCFHLREQGHNFPVDVPDSSDLTFAWAIAQARSRVRAGRITTFGQSAFSPERFRRQIVRFDEMRRMFEKKLNQARGFPYSHQERTSVYWPLAKLLFLPFFERQHVGMTGQQLIEFGREYQSSTATPSGP